MSIGLVCPHCGQQMQVAYEHLGALVGCPYCGQAVQTLRLPAPSPVQCPPAQPGFSPQLPRAESGVSPWMWGVIALGASVPLILVAVMLFQSRSSTSSASKPAGAVPAKSATSEPSTPAPEKAAIPAAPPAAPALAKSSNTELATPTPKQTLPAAPASTPPAPEYRRPPGTRQAKFGAGAKVASILISDGFSEPYHLPRSKTLSAPAGAYFYIVDCTIDTSRWPSERIDFLNVTGTNIRDTDLVLKTKDGRQINPIYAGYASELGGKEWVFARGPLRNVAVVVGDGAADGKPMKISLVYVARKGTLEKIVEADRGGILGRDRGPLELHFAFIVPADAEVEAIGITREDPTALDNSAPRQPEPAAVRPPERSPRRAAAGSSDDVLPGLPADFAFLAMTTATRTVDLMTVTTPPFTVGARNARESILKKEPDQVQGLHGKGLTVEQKNEGSVLSRSFEMHLLWTPEPFACYRDRRLLGIWDPQTRKLRKARSGEAPELLEKDAQAPAPGARGSN